MSAQFDFTCVPEALDICPDPTATGTWRTLALYPELLTELDDYTHVRLVSHSEMEDNPDPDPGIWGWVVDVMPGQNTAYDTMLLRSRDLESSTDDLLWMLWDLDLSTKP